MATIPTPTALSANAPATSFVHDSPSNTRHSAADTITTPPYNKITAPLAETDCNPVFWKICTSVTPVTPRNSVSREISGRFPCINRIGSNTPSAITSRRAPSVHGSYTSTSDFARGIDRPHIAALKITASRAKTRRFSFAVNRSIVASLLVTQGRTYNGRLAPGFFRHEKCPLERDSAESVV